MILPAVMRHAFSAVMLACAPVGLASGAAHAADPGATTTDAPRIVAYVTAWSPPVPIDAQRITHVNFAFGQIVDGQVQVASGAAAARLQRLANLRKARPQLRVLLSVGGWGAEGFSDAALDDVSRRRFAASTVDIIERFELDGVDLDWEYPGQGIAGIKARAEDREHFTRLLATLRSALDAAGNGRGRRGSNHYLLTIATADHDYLAHVDMPQVHPLVDWCNVMAYDFYNSLTPMTGHHAGWRRAATAPVTDRWAESAIAQHLAAGVPARKLVLGVAFYGRRFEGVEPAHDGLNQPYAKYGGDHSYQELVTRFIDRNGYERHWDEEAGAPWLWNPATRNFITYDDPESIRRKATYARRLGGVMFWELSQDTPDGALLRAVARGLGVSPKDISD